MDKVPESVFFHPGEVARFNSVIVNEDIEQLIETPPAQCAPVTTIVKNFNVHFIPSHFSKFARQKVKSVQKVQTVGKIRKQFDNDNFRKWNQILVNDETELIDLLLSNNCDSLMTKVKMLFDLKSPLTRKSWNIVSRLIKNKYLHKIQYVLVDGKKIKLSGSMGGDVEQVRIDVRASLNKQNLVKAAKQANIPTKITNGNISQRALKRGIMNEMDLKFKPGPLSKKPKLNKSDKNMLGELQLMRLPSVGLEVFPRIGVKLDSIACLHLKGIRGSSGLIDSKWANFATSVVEDSGNGSKKNLPTSHTFVLPYENNQNRIIVQKDLDFTLQNSSLSYPCNSPVDVTELDSPLPNLESYEAVDSVDLDVKNLLSQLIQTVAVSEVQDRLWEWDPDYNPVEQVKSKYSKAEAPKLTKKKNCELDRLNVTVIDVNEESDESEQCSNEYCKFGCVCGSLNSKYLLNEHCGVPECMLNCSCNFEKYSSQRSNETTVISKSAVANLQHHMNKYLAKEEQKFRRTVIRSKDQTIVMGACRRGARVPKKYQDYEYSLDIKPGSLKKAFPRTIKIVLENLPTSLHLQPWCMVHQLYRCFCKGRFVVEPEFKFNTYKSSLSMDSVEEYINLHFSKDPSQGNEKIPDYIATILDSSEDEILNIIDVPPLSSGTLKKGTYECARTSYFSKYIFRSRKRNFKYQERNARIIREESNNFCLKKKLALHIKLADGKMSEEGKSKVSVLKPNVVQKPVLQGKQIVPRESRLDTIQESVDINGIEELLNSTNMSSNDDLPALTSNSPAFMYSWKKLLSDFCCAKIFIWITYCKPYRIYFTSSPQIKSKSVCVPVVFNKPVEEDLLLCHRPVLKDIVDYDFNAHSSVILYGRVFAWELVGNVNKGNTCDTIPTTSVIAKKSTTKTISPFVWPKISHITGNFPTSSTEPSKGAIDSNMCIDAPLSPFSNEEGEISTLPDPIKPTEGIPKLTCQNIIKKNSQNGQKPTESPKVACKAQVVTKKLVPIIKAPESMPGNCKYRWLFLRVEDDFTDLKVPEKNFHISFANILETMKLACETGKTCKYPSGPILTYKPLPEYGLYAVADNHLKEAFLGPYIFDEKMSLKVTPKPGVTKVRICSSWTKAIINPNIIVYSNEETQGNLSPAESRLQNKLVYIYKHLPVKANIKIKSLSKPQTAIKKVTLITPKDKENNNSEADEVKASCVFSDESTRIHLESDEVKASHVISDESTRIHLEPTSSKEAVEDDDVIFIPKNEEIIEILDSDNE